MEIVVDANALIAVILNEPEKQRDAIPASPLDVEGINTDISTDEIVRCVREQREI